MKIATKINIAVSFSALLILSGALGSYFYFHFKESKTRNQEDLISRINIISEKIKLYNENQEIIALELARVGEAIYNNYKSKITKKNKIDLRPIFEKAISQKAEDIPGFTTGGIWMEPGSLGEKFIGPYAIKTDGKIQISWEFSNELYNYQSQDWYESALPLDWDRKKKRENNYYASKPFIENPETEKLPIFKLTRPMYSDSGEIIGLSSSNWAVSSLIDYIKKEEDEGNVIILSLGDMILYPTEDAGLPYGLYQKKIQENIVLIKSGATDPVKIQFKDNIKLSQNDFAMASTNLPYNLEIMILRPDFLFMKLIYYNLALISFPTIIAFLLSILFLRGFIHRVFMRLRTINETLSDIVEGRKDFLVQFETHSKDELGQTAQILNMLLEKITKKYQTQRFQVEVLEKRLREATDSLNDAFVKSENTPEKSKK